MGIEDEPGRIGRVRGPRRALRFGTQGEGGGAPAWSPAQLPGLLSWHRADLNVTASGGAVSAWGNASGSPDANRNAVQLSVPDQPTLVASDAAFGGKPSIAFASGTTQRLVTGAYSTAPAFPYTVIWIGARAGGTYFWDNRAGAQAAGVILGNVFNSYAGSFLACTGSSLTTSPAIVFATFAGGSPSTVEAAFTGPVTGTNGSNLPTGFTIGSSLVPSGSGSRCAEFIVMSGALDAAGKANVYAYALAQYGLGWTPLNLTLLQGFWRADSVSAAPVALWPNSSGVVDATRDLVQPTVAWRPATYVASDPDFGGKPSVQSTIGSDQRMMTGTFTSPTTNAATFFAVVRANPTSYEMIGQMNPSRAGQGLHAYVRYFSLGGGNFGLQAQNGSDICNWTVDVKNKTLGLILVYTATAIKLYVNGPTLRGSVALTSPYYQPTQLSTVGFEPAGIYGGVHVAEAGMIAAEMTPTEMTALFNYWNVTRGYGLATIP